MVFAAYILSDMIFETLAPTPDRENIDDLIPEDISLSHKDLTTEDGYTVRLFILEHKTDFNTDLPPLYL